MASFFDLYLYLFLSVLCGTQVYFEAISAICRLCIPVLMQYIYTQNRYSIWCSISCDTYIYNCFPPLLKMTDSAKYFLKSNFSLFCYNWPILDSTVKFFRTFCWNVFVHVDKIDYFIFLFRVSSFECWTLWNKRTFLVTVTFLTNIYVRN